MTISKLFVSVILNGLMMIIALIMPVNAAYRSYYSYYSRSYYRMGVYYRSYSRSYFSGYYRKYYGLYPYYSYYYWYSSRSRDPNDASYGECKNLEIYNDTYIGYFSCPQSFEPLSFNKCCGNKDAQYCCEGNNVWAIIGYTIGSIICLGIAVALLICICKSFNRSKRVVTTSRVTTVTTINTNAPPNAPGPMSTLGVPNPAYPTQSPSLTPRHYDIGPINPAYPPTYYTSMGWSSLNQYDLNPPAYQVNPPGATFRPQQTGMPMNSLPQTKN